jgi:hypothetical protein
MRAVITRPRSGTRNPEPLTVLNPVAYVSPLPKPSGAMDSGLPAALSRAQRRAPILEAQRLEALHLSGALWLVHGDVALRLPVCLTSGAQQSPSSCFRSVKPLLTPKAAPVIHCFTQNIQRTNMNISETRRVLCFARSSKPQWNWSPLGSLAVRSQSGRWSFLPWFRDSAIHRKIPSAREAEETLRPV